MNTIFDWSSKILELKEIYYLIGLISPLGESNHILLHGGGSIMTVFLCYTKLIMFNLFVLLVFTRCVPSILSQTHLDLNNWEFAIENCSNISVTSGGSKGDAPSVCLPMAQNFLNFMHFGKIWHMVKSWHPSYNGNLGSASGNGLVIVRHAHMVFGHCEFRLNGPKI